MKRITRLTFAAAGSLVLLCDCTDYGWQAAVGQVGGGAGCAATNGCKGTTDYVLVTPTAEPLSERSARITWTAPAGHVAWYEVRVTTPSAPVAIDGSAGRLPGNATSVVLTDLEPGTLGQVVVAASIPGAPPASAPSTLLWTPFGAVNEDSVNSVTPLAGYSGAPYAEGMFVSSHFSMFFAHAYAPEASFVFDGMPCSPTARPVYNFASPVMRYPNGFRYAAATDVTQIWSDGVSRVLLSNFHENRIIIYNHLPLTPETAAPDLLLGQTTWSGTDANGGEGAVNARGLSEPGGACFDGANLYVRDHLNNRVLGWHGWPTQMGQPADFVLGQPDMGSSAVNAGGVSKGSLSFGFDAGHTIDCRGGHLVVVDPGNHRVLLWNTAPATSGVPADVVLGQSSGDANGPAGAGGLGAGGMLFPSGAAFIDGGAGRTGLLVADGNANRVVAWSSLPASDGAPFDKVFGQPDRTTTTANSGGLSMASLSFPVSVSVDDTNRFWVADFNNGRALRFSLDSATAIDLYGQRDGTSTEVLPGSFSTTRSGWSHWTPGELSLDPASGLFTTAFQRAMIWSTPPLDGNTPVTAIQGQADAASSSTGPTSPTSLKGLGSAVSLGGRVYWSDTNRILSKPGTFTGSNATPDIVLGDEDFEGNVVAATSLDYAIQPTFLATDGAKLLAVDGARIVGWNVAPSASHARVDFALGQPDLLNDTANDGGVTASTLGGGRNAMTIAGGKLVVADPANHRVLVWNTIPSLTGAPADVVIGQPDFVSSVPGSGMAQMNGPSSVAVLDGHLVVSDTGNARLMVFDAIPSVSGVAAARVWDPRTSRFSLPSWFDDDQLTPHDLGAYDGRLYIGQTGRILVIPDIFEK